MLLNELGHKAKIKELIILFVCFWVILLFFMALEKPVNRILTSDSLNSFELRRFNPLRPKSEYKISEQLSKFYLFIIILTSIYSYKIVNEKQDIKISISFIVLGMIMYFSESNFINNKMQPVFGAVILFYLLSLLYKKKARICIFLIIISFLVISIGLLVDQINDGYFPGFKLNYRIEKILNLLHEETYDFIGIGFLCFSVLFYFFNIVKEFVRSNIKCTAYIILFSLMISFGNGFLHYKYEPVIKLEIVALILTYFGFGGFLFVNNLLKNKGKEISLISCDIFYLFIFGFFVILPIVYGDHNRGIESVLFWIPFFILFSSYLYKMKKINND